METLGKCVEEGTSIINTMQMCSIAEWAFNFITAYLARVTNPSRIAFLTDIQQCGTSGFPIL